MLSIVRWEYEYLAKFKREDSEDFAVSAEVNA
jgi:hypothetical protein